MGDFLKWITGFLDWGSMSGTQQKLFITLMAFGIIVLVRFIAIRVISRLIRDATQDYEWKRGTQYLAAFIMGLVVIRIWWEGFGTVVTFLGLVSAGLAIALKDLLANMAGWLFLVWKRPFHVGDRIQIGEQYGDVIDIRLFQFTLMEIGNWVFSDQSTGRILHIPNGRVFLEPQANYTQAFPYIWNEIPVMLTFESDWAKAKKLLQKIADELCAPDAEDVERQMREARKRYLILYRTLTPIVYTDVHEFGVRLVIRYLCHSRRRRDSEQEVWENILRAFQRQDDIAFAYPTTRFYNRAGELKSSGSPSRDTP